MIGQDKIFTTLPKEFERFRRNTRQLRRILHETERSLDEITHAKLFPDENIKESVLTPEVIQELSRYLDYHPALIILGQNSQARALVVNSLFGEEVLPPKGGSWRWVRIMYGTKSRVSLTLGFEIEVVEKLKANEKPWTTIPEADLNLSGKGVHDHCTELEVQINHPLLKENVQIIIPPDRNDVNPPVYHESLQKNLEKVIPILLYVIADDSLKEKDIFELQELSEIFPNSGIYFIYVKQAIMTKLNESTEDLTESEQHQIQENIDFNVLSLIHQLCNLGFLGVNNHDVMENRHSHMYKTISKRNSFLDSLDKLDEVLLFVRECLQSYLVRCSNRLNNINETCLRKFILCAFDMAREIQITPRRIQYALKKEEELYRNLLDTTSEKQEEITSLIQSTLQEMRSTLISKAEHYEYKSFNISENTAECSQYHRIATSEIQNLILNHLSKKVTMRLMESVDCLQETFVGTLSRCLESLEKNCKEPDRNLLASDAFRQILSSAYNLKLTASTSSSLLHSFLEGLRKILHAFQPWSSAPKLDAQWRKQIATEMLDSLNASRLARNISVQFKDRVQSSHEAFQAALQNLKTHYSGKLEQTEEQRIKIRKHYAPRVARHCLESTSMCDMLLYGIPKLDKEIGRGQYGVVYACQSPWGGDGVCAVKSVVPPDDKHWNDLAMEFYYTRTIPSHDRIVHLRGSVIDYNYGAGYTPAVLLIMDRVDRDLFCALQAGLMWLVRLQIAIDVAEGIRYLHSQGLVHRDIKLKNVLLDAGNRAKLTDLGFCIPEAMMSGSIVGTPVHMAPELISRHYDSSVDVYAFGILFWYICAGHVQLPYVFKQYLNKDQLWEGVKRGIRPERLPYFDNECWNLMEQCWAGDSTKRPLLGTVLPILQSIMKSQSVMCNQDIVISSV